MASSNIFQVLFVCHGNICRSPMGEYILQDMVNRMGVSARFEIASAATSTEEIGNDVYPPARRVLEAHGVPCGHRRARQLRKVDAVYDFIICMDAANVRNARRILGPAAEGKVVRLNEYRGLQTDVDDPWYSGDFETCFDDISAGCAAFLASLGY